MGFPGGADGKESTCPRSRHERRVWSLGQEDPLEEGMAAHSSILAWRIPWTEEPGRSSTGSQRRHDWVSMHTHTYLEPIKNWNKRSAPNVKGRERKTEGARKGSREDGRGRETRALARTGFTAVPYPLSLLGRISAAPALVSCNQLFSCPSHPKSKGCLWKPILWPCVRLAWSRLFLGQHPSTGLDGHTWLYGKNRPT